MLNKIQISFAINILIIIFGFTALVPEIVTASSKNKSKTDLEFYKTVYDFFRFFTNDGNVYSTIISCIIISYQISILFFGLNPNILNNNYLYLLALGSAVSEIIILLVVFILLLPYFGLWVIFANYAMFVLHVLIPIIVTFRFIFFDKKESKISNKQTLFGSAPVLIYGIIILILVLSGVFNKENNRIPYPFFNFDSESWLFSTFSVIGIIAVTFGLCILFNYLNEKYGEVLFEEKEDITDLNSHDNNPLKTQSDNHSLEL